jgi:hypothetical protein
VWASWNGATDVSGWRILTGTRPSALTTVAGTHPVAGFETAVTVAGRPAYVAVQALAADGSVLASSAAIAP